MCKTEIFCSRLIRCAKSDWQHLCDVR